MRKTTKYIAIKVKGLNHWLWFDTTKVTRDSGIFIGKGGWGKSGAFTEIKIEERYISGEIESTDLQYV